MVVGAEARGLGSGVEEEWVVVELWVFSVQTGSDSKTDGKAAGGKKQNKTKNRMLLS